MPYSSNLSTQAPYCLGNPSVTPLANCQPGYVPAISGPRRPHTSASDYGYLLAAQLATMAAIIWAVFSIAVSSAMSAHRSHDTWQRPPVLSRSIVTGSRNRSPASDDLQLQRLILISHRRDLQLLPPG